MDTKTEDKISPSQVDNETETEAKNEMYDLIYWRNPRKTGVILAATLAITTCFAIYPIITIIMYTCLLVILGSLACRMYIMGKLLIRKTKQVHPFKHYLEKTGQIQARIIHQLVDDVSKPLQRLVDYLARIFLVENLVETLKFASYLWSLTYVNTYLSTMAFVIIVIISIFTIPKFYQTFPHLDYYYDIMKRKFHHLQESVHEKVHQLKKKTHHE